MREYNKESKQPVTTTTRMHLNDTIHSSYSYHHHSPYHTGGRVRGSLNSASWEVPMPVLSQFQTLLRFSPIPLLGSQTKRTKCQENREKEEGGNGHSSCDYNYLLMMLLLFILCGCCSCYRYYIICDGEMRLDCILTSQVVSVVPWFCSISMGAWRVVPRTLNLRMSGYQALLIVLLSVSLRLF